MIDVGKGFGGESVARVTIPAENGGFPRRGEETVRGLRLGAGVGGGVDQVWRRGRVGGCKVYFGPASPEGQLHFA